MSDSLEISGGGSIEVETAGMLRAAAELESAHAALGGLIRRTGACIDAAAPGSQRLQLEEARMRLAEAQTESRRAADGLRTAAGRYGMAEHAALAAQRAVWATVAASIGAEARLLLTSAGPPAVLLLGDAVLTGAAVLVVARTAAVAATTGEVEPQLDPVLLDGLGLALTSLDDVLRGTLLAERPADLLSDDPAAPLGSEGIAALLAVLVTRRSGDPLTVTGGPERTVRKPGDLAALADRIPDGREPEGQVKVERYEDADGVRWIVYIAGTVTFEPDGGEEPFDLSSNLFGVADRPTDAQRSVLAAMEQAGIGADEPVLLVGHSQGALTAVRVAEHGGYRIGGVVELGGPTGQIVLPAEVPVIAAEHDEDLVPMLGGVAAGGGAGLRRLVVTRSLPRGGAAAGAPPLSAGVPAHGTGFYAETLREAEASGDGRVRAFRDRIGGFLDGGREGTVRRYRARRISPAPVPTAAAGSGR